MCETAGMLLGAGSPGVGASPGAARSPGRARGRAVTAARLVLSVLFWGALGALCFAGFMIGRLQCGRDLRGCFAQPRGTLRDGALPPNTAGALALPGQGSYATVQVRTPAERVTSESGRAESDSVHMCQHPEMLPFVYRPNQDHLVCCALEAHKKPSAFPFRAAASFCPRRRSAQALWTAYRA